MGEFLFIYFGKLFMQLRVQVIGSEVCLESHRFSRNHYRLVTATVNIGAVYAC